ncbi:MAG: hypothetical protein WDO24_08760 [Pseudomonadota bacterium]
MRDEIIAMCLARLDVPSLAAVRADPALRAAMVRLLRDCPPLPVVCRLIAELEAAPT